MHAAQERTFARNELARAERLDQIVIGTKLETDDAVFHFTFCREHDDGRVGIITNNATDAFARNAWKHEVQDDQVEMVTREFLKCFLAISHGDHLIVLTLEISRDRITDGLFIFDEKNATGIVAHIVLLI